LTYRVVFLGSPEFAVPSLRSLVDNPHLDVTLCVTQPDRRAGRGRRLTPPQVALYASEAGVPLFQPQSLRDDISIARLEEALPDVLVVVAYGEILTRRVLRIAPHGALNVHPSLLPKYRGAAPIPAAIANGDRITGVSIMKMIRRLDAGPVVASFPVDIPPRATTSSLSLDLAALAATHLPAVIGAWIEGSLEPIEQDEADATYTREWTKADGMIDWHQPADVIERLVRAAIPWPVAWTMHNGARVQVRESRVFAGTGLTEAIPGEVQQRDASVIVRTGDGWLELITVQPESKRPLQATVWWQTVDTARFRFRSHIT
jgi:methionyl-tRNA formyltransferase